MGQAPGDPVQDAHRDADHSRVAPIRSLAPGEPLAPIISIADGAAIPTLAELGHEVPTLPGSMTCEGLDRLFGRSADLDCVLVRHPTVADVTGLVQRSRFEALMAGPFGYGRPLHGRRPVTEIAEWDILVLRANALIEEAASRAITRPPEHVHDHVVVQGDRGLTVLPMPVLLAALARSLADRALRDSLTGLANRELLFGRVEEACRRTATRPDHANAVIYLDLDGFKTVNDGLGHAGGDELLQQVARALVESARPTDLVARLGGDEFAVSVETDGTDQPIATLAASIAERLHSAVATVLRSTHPPASLRTSIGVAVCGAGSVDAGELVRAADLAMYTAKRAGGDRIAEPVVVSSAAHADPLLGTSVAQAAARGEFVLHYQPIVFLADGRVASLEALVRWQHPSLGLLSPASFLPSVERAGQLVELDDWVARTACRDFALWQAQQPTGGPPPYLNINLSTARLITPGAVDDLLAAAQAAGLSTSTLRVEVSEDLLFEQIEAVSPVLRALAQAGVAVTFDDVGAGSTSLRHLRDVRADGLKIDRTYVQGMVTEERDRAVVRLLIDFALGTGSRVTAEGVETEEQRALLVEMGCEFGQGWLFGRPVPLSAVDLSAGLVDSPLTSG